MSAPTCLECAAPLLPAVDDEEGDGDLFWCPRCDAIEKLERGFGRPRPPPPSDITNPTTLRWKGHLELDGSVSFELGPGTGTPAEVRRAVDALQYLAFRGEQRQLHLRGADRYTFRRVDGGLFRARILDQEADLVPWRCGGRRPDARGRVMDPERCDACKTDLAKGTDGYRATENRSPRYGSVSWGSVRFCAPCVEAAPTVEARGVLRVIDGGQAKSAVGKTR